MSTEATLTLIDAPTESGRSTATLLASLTARLATLHFVTGATAVGSLLAGFAALGREVAGSAEGARLKQALLASRAGPNGDALWSTLRIGDWTAGLFPSPMLDQLHNDMALMLAPDLQETLDLLPIPSPSGSGGAAAAAEAPRPNAVDCLVGMWAFGQQLTTAVEAIAGPLLASRPRVAPPPPDVDGEAPAPGRRAELLR